MKKMYALSMSATSLVLCMLLGARPAKAADVNYAELRGNAVSMQETTHFNIYTQQSTLTEVSITLRTIYGGISEDVTVNCPTNGTAVTTLCRDASTLLLGCPVVVATSTCFPDASGDCDFVTFKACSSGVGKCMWGWGPFRTKNGVQRPLLEALWTQNGSSCTTK